MGILSALINDVEGAINDVMKQAEQVTGLKDVFNNAISPLKAGGWTGKGAEAFYSAAETELIKGIESLVGSIGGLGDAINSALDIIKEADAIASAPVDAVEGAIDAVGSLF